MDRTASEAEAQKRIKIFFCYAHEDELLLNQLKNHLQPLQRQGLIQFWYDREIRAGSEWEPVIKKQLEMAQIILVLVSPDFMASDYCYTVEMTHALERHQRGEATVIPIILRPIYWHGGPLGRLQALPTDGKPVTDAEWHTPDKAFYNITSGISEVIEKMKVARSLASPDSSISERRQETGKPEYTPLDNVQRENSASFSTPLLSEQPTLSRTIVGHTGPVLSVAISPDGKTLVSGSADTAVKVWNLATGQEMRTLSGHTHAIRCIAMSPDGETLVSGSDDKTIKVWNLASGQEIRTLSGHKEWVLSIAMSPDGKTLVSGSWNETIKVWNLASGQEIRTLSGHTGFAAWLGMYHLMSVDALVISPDGEMLVSGIDTRIKIWNLTTGQEIRTLSGHKTLVRCIAMSPDGETLVSGAEYDTSRAEYDMIKVWKLSTGQEIRTLHTGASGIYSLVISPDGTMLVSGVHKEIKIWNLATGQEIHTLRGLSTTNNESLTMSPDGKTLACGFFDGTIEVWSI